MKACEVILIQYSILEVYFLLSTNSFREGLTVVAAICRGYARVSVRMAQGP